MLLRVAGFGGALGQRRGEEHGAQGDLQHPDPGEEGCPVCSTTGEEEEGNCMKAGVSWH